MDEFMAMYSALMTESKAALVAQRNQTSTSFNNQTSTSYNIGGNGNGNGMPMPSSRIQTVQRSGGSSISSNFSSGFSSSSFSGSDFPSNFPSSAAMRSQQSRTQMRTTVTRTVQTGVRTMTTSRRTIGSDGTVRMEGETTKTTKTTGGGVTQVSRTVQYSAESKDGETVTSFKSSSPTVTTTTIWTPPTYTAETQEYLDEVNDLSRLSRHDRFQSRFDDAAPLYQVYQYITYKKPGSIGDRGSRLCLPSIGDDEDDSVYDDVSYKPTLAIEPPPPMPIYSTEEENTTCPSPVPVDPKELEETAAEARGRFLSANSGRRTLWQEMPEVKQSGILDKLSPKEIKFQESMFEILTSEASYLKSLQIFIRVFMMAPQFKQDNDDCILNKHERHHLFSNIVGVMESCERFLYDLESRWQQNIYMTDVCDIIAKHAAENFGVYIVYCTNQVYQTKQLESLKQNTAQFMDTLKALNINTECQGLPFHSFLMLPMQRITRLPMLIEAVYKQTEDDSAVNKSVAIALGAVSKLVNRCNEGARKMACMEEMLQLEKHLIFKSTKKIPIVSASRHRIKSGDLTWVPADASSKKFSLIKSSCKQIHLILFNDFLLITKKKGPETYSVIDYCTRQSLHVENVKDPEKDTRLPKSIPSNCSNIFILALLENHEKKQEEYVLGADSESTRERWVDALCPTVTANDDETIYETWDCPQVEAIYPYEAQQPDELDLEESDIVNVHKKLSDGWNFGERIRDGQRGWFHDSYTTQIINEHVRARNLKQRYRLLCLSKAQIDSQVQQQQQQENKVNKKMNSAVTKIMKLTQVLPIK